MIDLNTLQKVLNARFGGVLKAGKHAENGECCALELLSACRQIPWTDDPNKVGSWDLRGLNDILVSDKIRTTHFLPVLALYADSRAWPKARQKKVVTKLAILTVNRIVAELPGMPDSVRTKCREATDLKSAAANAAITKSAINSAAAAANAVTTYAAINSAAAAAAAAATTNSAIYAAYAAANAAAYAAYAAYGDAYDDDVGAREKVFVVACQVWIDATN